MTAPVFRAGTHAEMDGVKYRETSIYRSEPLYPGRAATLALSYLIKEKAKVPFFVWWQRPVPDIVLFLGPSLHTW